MTQQPTIQTDRLLLRPYQISDAPDVQRLAGQYEIAATTLNIPHPYEDGVAEEWIAYQADRFDDGDGADFAIALRETGELVGAIGFVIYQRHCRAELGYWIGVPYWGKGYATEAARAVVHYGFSTLELNRIHAVHFSSNEASGKVMQKIGMKHEGTLRQHMVKWDKFVDLEAYGVLREEWKRLRKSCRRRPKCQ